MFKGNRITVLLAALFFVMVFSQCSKKWDKHNAITNNALNNNLAEAISNTPNLTKFSDLLVKSGYDKIISSSKTYTVWAPTDQALQSLDPSITSDSVKLKMFVANHITNQSYLAGSGGDQRIKMLNGKYITVSTNKFDSANIVTANAYSNNGIFHIIDKYIPRMDNIWEFVNNTTVAPLMKSFLQSLNRNAFDPSIAKQTGVNPTTGLPVYDTATGTVVRNNFLDSVINVSDETSEYTLILLTDGSFTAEMNKLMPWFVTSTTDSTTRLSGVWLVKDLAFKGVYTAAQLPDTLMSQYGVKVPINKSAITASYRTSNGIVHVMSQVNFNLKDKFPPIYIQGEKPTGFAADRRGNTFYRVRFNPVTGQNFNDIMITNYGFANYYIRYAVKGLNSMRYNAYWVAVNDLQTTPLWQQRLANGFVRNDTAFVTTLPAVTIAYNDYNEVFLGQFTFTTFANRDFLVYGPTTSSTTGNNNAITLDYIKLEPAF